MAPGRREGDFFDLKPWSVGNGAEKMSDDRSLALYDHYSITEGPTFVIVVLQIL